MDVIINPYNMSEIEGVRDALPGATAKYATDLILDSIIYQWGLSIPHSTKKACRRKIRLSERHLAFLERYATQRHISITTATNLVLNDYFSSRISADNAYVAKITPHQTNSETPVQNTPSTEKPKPLRGNALLQNLKG